MDISAFEPFSPSLSLCLSEPLVLVSAVSTFSLSSGRCLLKQLKNEARHSRLCFRAVLHHSFHRHLLSPVCLSLRPSLIRLCFLCLCLSSRRCLEIKVKEIEAAKEREALTHLRFFFYPLVHCCDCKRDPSQAMALFTLSRHSLLIVQDHNTDCSLVSPNSQPSPVFPIPHSPLPPTLRPRPAHAAALHCADVGSRRVSHLPWPQRLLYAGSAGGSCLWRPLRL